LHIIPYCLSVVKSFFDFLQAFYLLFFKFNAIESAVKINVFKKSVELNNAMFYNITKSILREGRV